MEYVALGRTGLKVSRLCFGTMTYGSKKWREWVLEEDEARPFFRRAIELGINFFDTADMYSRGASEEITGRALKEFGGGRDRVVIATKVFNPMGDAPNQRGLGRKHIHHAIDESLRRLGTDYIDLYIIHRLDLETPMEEIMQALHDVVRAGKALYIGASSMYTWQFAKLQHIADQHGLTRFVAMQNHYNLIYREEEREMNPYCVSEGVAITPWSPTARGLLAEDRNPGDSGATLRSRTDDYGKSLYYRPEDKAVIERLTDVAKRVGKRNIPVALAWLLARPGVTAPIVGATKISHLEDAVSALDIRLSEADITALEEPYAPHPVIGIE